MRDAGVGIEAVAIDQQRLGPDVQLVDGSVHGGDAGPQDIGLVYFPGAHHGHGPRHGLALDDGTQQVALVLGELFAVVDERVLEVWRQNDGGGCHRPGQAASSGFVAAGLDATLDEKSLQHDGELVVSLDDETKDAVQHRGGLGLRESVQNVVGLLFEAHHGGVGIVDASGLFGKGHQCGDVLGG